MRRLALSIVILTCCSGCAVNKGVWNTGGSFRPAPEIALQEATLSAREDWVRLANEGNAIGQNNLGVMYLQGQGVERDDAKALYWFRKAATQGSASAQTTLGEMYAQGRGVTRDDTEALRWFHKAAVQGSARARMELGEMYAQGRGVDRDDAEALRWFRQAAEQNYAPAQAELGVIYEQGQGVPRDLAEGQRWYERAAAILPPGPERDAMLRASQRLAQRPAP